MLRGVVVCLVVAGFVLSGCTRVWLDPYINLPNRELSEGYEPSDGFPQLLIAAQQAEELRRTASEYRTDLVEKRSLLSYGAFGAAAAGGIAALYGAHSDLVLGLGLGAAGAYGAGTLFTSTDRIDTYSAANKALNCVVETADSVLATAAKLDEMIAIDSTASLDMQALEAAIADGSTAVNNVNADASLVELNARTFQAMDEYLAAKKNVDMFRALDPEFAVAVTQTRDVIIFAMEERIRQSQPSLANILQVAQGIGVSGVNYVQEVTAVEIDSSQTLRFEEPEAVALSAEQLSETVKAINEAIDEATNKMAQIGNTCIFEQAPIAPLTVMPAQITLTADQTITLDITGGKEPFIAMWQGANQPTDKQIEVVVSGRQVVLVGKSTLDDIAAQSEFVLVIRDTLAAPKEGQVKVTVPKAQNSS